MNSNWGLVDPLETSVRDKKRKREVLGERAQAHFLAWMAEHGIEPAEHPAPSSAAG
jgi:folate-dependent tRNA-U54 methylase TrmFO/GidA